MSEDGVTEYGKRAVIKGDDCPDPISEGLFETPAKESTEVNTFSHIGWSLTANGSAEASPLADITEDKVLFAVFKSEVRYYTLNFYDGEVLLNTEQVAYMGSSDYVYTKSGYSFGGWIPEPTNITGNMDCVGTWVEIGLNSDSWETIAQRSADGTASSVYKIGDTKSVTLTHSDGTTEQATFAIAGFNIHKGEDGVASGITFIQVNGYSSKFKITNQVSTSKGFYEANEESFTTIFNALPQDLQNVIKTTRISSKYYPSKTVTDVESDIKVFIPEGIEFTGKSLKASNYNGVNSGTESIFPIFSSFNILDLIPIGSANSTGVVTQTLLYHSTYGTTRLCLITTDNVNVTTGTVNVNGRLTPCFRV